MFETVLNQLEHRINQICDRDYTPEMFSFEWFAVAISYGYGLGVKFRLWLYKKGVLRQKRLPCFVISVGNIVAGGAGKTPMAIYLSDLLQKMGKQVVVLSRGYKGQYKGPAAIVCDGEHIFLTAEESGDEPYMMARRRTFPVVIGKDRFTAGLKAIEAFRPDVIVLDDGFQHVKLKRDLNFLLLDYLRPLGNTRLIPAGRLREPFLESVPRADALIFTRSPDVSEKNQNNKTESAFFPGRPWFKTFHRPFVVTHIAGSTNLTPPITRVSGLKGKNALLFSGIAKNISFFDAMTESGVNVLDHLEFKDHYRYKDPDILRINTLADKMGADMILTTEKDWAKLDQELKWGLDLVVIGIQIAFEHSQQFESFLQSRLYDNE